MSTTPAPLADLASYWQSQGGVFLGIVGNLVHCKGYHLGKDRIYGDCACRPKGICVPGLRGDDYSVQATRDRAGLTNAAAAIDLGKLQGSFTDLYDFSSWLVRRCRENAPGTADVREVIYSPDGVTVLRYDRQRGYNSLPRPGEADASHITHTHLSFYRDSEHRDKVGLFAPYFTAEDGMVYVIYDTDVQSLRTGEVQAGTAFYNDYRLGDKRGTVSATSRIQVMGYRGEALACQVITGQGWADGKARPTLVFFAKSDVTAITVVPVPDSKHRVTLTVDGAPVWSGDV